MGLIDKIDEIRSKPEHIRMRYVWLFVVISMIFVVVVWIFSMKVNRNEATERRKVDVKVLIDQYNDEKKSLEDAKRDVKSGIDGITQGLQ